MPYKSLKQAQYFNANKAELEKQGVDVNEWNQESKSKLDSSKGENMSDKWIGAVSKEIEKKGHKGIFSSAAKRAGKTTKEYAEEKKNAPGKTGKRARLALVFMNAKK